MKNISIILIAFLCLSCLKSNDTSYNTEGDIVFLYITKNTTKNELESLSKEFKLQRNISIDFSNSNFNIEGKIINMELKVDCNDGFKGKTTISKELLKVYNFGFTRDYSEDADLAFKIGKI